MNAPSCYVVSATEWGAAGDALAQVIVLLLVCVWAAGVDWWRLGDLIQRHMRRRRLRAIRAAKASA